MLKILQLSRKVYYKKYNLLILFTLFFLFENLNVKLSIDEGIWSYIGHIWYKYHLPPYINSIENKTPGIFYIYYLANFLHFNPIYFTRFFAVLSSIFTIYFISKISYKLFNNTRITFYTTLFFGLTYCWDIIGGNVFVRTETFMVLFSTISFYLIIKDKKAYFLSGVSLGVAIIFKQIALFTFIYLLILILYYRCSKTNYLIFILGVLFINLVSFIPLFLSDISFTQYLEGAWLILLKSGSSANLKDRYLGFINLWFNSRLSIIYLIIVFYFFYFKNFKDKVLNVLLIWFFIEFIAVNASGNYYGHQIKQLFPPLSLLFGYIYFNIFKNVINKLHIYLLIVILFPYEFIFIHTPIKIFNSNDKNKDLGIYLKNNTNSIDYIYILGNKFQSNIIQYYTTRLSSSKYFNSIFLNYPKDYESLKIDILKNTPKYFLIYKSEFDTFTILFKTVNFDLQLYLQNNYRLEQIRNDYFIFKQF